MLEIFRFRDIIKSVFWPFLNLNVLIKNISYKNSENIKVTLINSLLPFH